MKELEIDIETKSDRDIVKCGVYAYADSPHFAITVFPGLSGIIKEAVHAQHISMQVKLNALTLTLMITIR